MKNFIHILVPIALLLLTACPMEPVGPQLQEFYIENPNALPVKYFEKITDNWSNNPAIDTIIIPPLAKVKVNDYKANDKDSYEAFLYKFKTIILKYNTKSLICDTTDKRPFIQKTEPFVKITYGTKADKNDIQIFTLTLDTLIFQ